MNEGYQLALRRYADIGIDTEKALQTRKTSPWMAHCSTATDQLIRNWLIALRRSASAGVFQQPAKSGASIC